MKEMIFYIKSASFRGNGAVNWMLSVSVILAMILAIGR